jgi:hypothetical protein
LHNRYFFIYRNRNQLSIFTLLCVFSSSGRHTFTPSPISNTQHTKEEFLAGEGRRHAGNMPTWNSHNWFSLYQLLLKNIPALVELPSLGFHPGRSKPMCSEDLRFPARSRCIRGYAPEPGRDRPRGALNPRLHQPVLRSGVRSTRSRGRIGPVPLYRGRGRRAGIPRFRAAPGMPKPGPETPEEWSCVHCTTILGNALIIVGVEGVESS